MALRICFTRSKKSFKPMSDLIIIWQNYRFKSQSPLPISHASGKFVGSNWGRDFFYQSSGHATNFMGGTLFKKMHELIEEYELDIDDELIKRIGQSCVDREGKPYALKQNFGIGLAGIAYFITRGRWAPRNPWADGDKETNCLEEWAYLLSLYCGYPEPDSDQLTPWEFRNWLKDLPIAKKVV